ncbi:MAG: hypothetical protein HYX27_03645 [Acidobacteria bacterium]|nr:hypothetical protein [Acidobacteriota bacterium]
MALRLFLLGLSASLFGQQIVTTYAGTEWVFPGNGRPALDAPLGSVLSVAIDPQGRTVFSDTLNHVIVRIEASGNVTVIAGNGVRGFSGDGGDALRASFDQPRGIAIDRTGNIFVSDTRNRRIRKITPAGIVTTIAGNGFSTPAGDNGPATSAALSARHIALDGAGNIYLADYDNSFIRRIGTDGIITTIAGDGDDVFSGDGKPALQTALSPFSIHVDSANRIIVGDIDNYRVLRIGTDGIVTTIIGTGTRGFSGDGGPGRAATLTNCDGITSDAAGNIFITDTSNRRIRKLTPAGIITTIAGGSSDVVGPSPIDPLRAAIGFPTTIAIDPQGSFTFADADNSRLLRLSPAGISQIAGNGKFKELLPRTPNTLVTMTEPVGLAVAPDGAVYYTEYTGHRIARIDKDGSVSRVTGTGVSSCCTDNGSALNGRVSFPAGVAVARDGSIIIADTNNDKIRRVSNGTITSLAGSFLGSGFSGDNGPAADALLSGPWGVVIDANGNIIFSDRYNNRIRRITPAGTITTIAGDGRGMFAGDGGQATAASLYSPTGLAINPAGELLIADYGNHRVRAISATGIIRTIAGTGVVGSSGDGQPATQATIRFPIGLAADRQGNVYITQDVGGAMRKIGTNGIISTFAGQVPYGFAGDGGSPNSAFFSRPMGITTDDAGNIYIADTQNNRVRVIRTLALTTTLSPSPVTLAAVTGSATTVPARVSLTSAVNGLPFTFSVTYGQQQNNWLIVTPSSDVAPATLTLNANATGLGPGRYTATINVTTTPPGTSNPVSVILNVSDAAPRLRLSSESISFTRNEGTAEQTTVLEVRNDGGGLLSYQISAVNTGTVRWLSISSAGGDLRAGEVGTVNVTANPSGLRGGTYLGSLTVAVGTARTVIPVTMTIRGGRRTILVSQSGLTFTAVAGGGSPTAQKIGVLNIGTGVLNWSASSKKNFVRLSPASGTVTEPWLEIGDLTISINPSGLTAGQYYDQIEITADADNSPQLVTILLNVLPEGSNPGPEVTPSGMIFIAKQGQNPGSQSVLLNHLGRGTVTYDSSRLGTWYDAAPSAGRAVANGPSNIVIAPALSGMTPGVRRGVVTFQLQEDGSIRTVNLLSVIAPPDAAGKDERGAASCAAPTLRVESTSLRDGFSVRVGEAVTVEVKASDECGNLLTPLAGGTGAQVVVRPENGDPQVALAHVGNGVWRGTWRPVRAIANTRLTVLAVFLGTTADVLAGRSQAGKVELSGVILAQGAASAPLLTAGGVVHAASFESGVPIAPGSLISLYGTRLADATGQAAAIPLPVTLNGTEVRLGNRPLPLLFTSDGQLNAQVPYDLPVDTQHQISVKRGEAIAVPETLNVAAAQPGIFTKAQNGSGQGAITKQDGVTLAQPGTPADRGEVVVIYSSGLGPVSPAVEAGRAAPASPLSGVVNPVSVTIGGQPAQVLFGGLTPGFSGLYQVNARIAMNATTGDAVEVTIESAGQRSRPVTIAIR